MALSNAITNNGAAAPAAQTVAAPAAPAGTAAAPKQGKTLTEAQSLRKEFAASGTAEINKMSEEDKKNLGSNSDDIAFVCALGDPLKPSVRTEGGNKNVPTYLVIGYTFKALKPISIPVAPYLPTSNDPMAVAPATTREVAAGEEFSLNLAETAMLLSRPEYAGKVSGEGKNVLIDVTISKDTKEPRPQLKLAESSGSIKANMQTVGEPVKDANGKIQGITLKPEYTAFQPYFDRRQMRQRSASRASSAAKAAPQQDIAMAFAKYFANKG